MAVSAKTYDSAFIARTKTARESTGPVITQEQMAEALGLQVKTYAKYESRTKLPHRFIPSFCVITRIRTDWLLSGLGAMRLSRTA